MSIKLILLKSGEKLIADAKELVIENPETNEKEIFAYLFNKPNVINVFRNTNSDNLLTEEVTPKNQSNGEELQVALSPWIILTSDDNITVPRDWVVTIVEPISSIKQMYEEKVNG